MDKPTIKIFISSPSDVLYERQIAKRVIAKLGKEFAASVKMEALLWEDMPLQATTSFQEGIDQVTKANLVDIAIFILWSRLGTPLGKKFVKPDGGLYKSGTEYEFEMMYSANQQTGVPSILAYIKNAPISDAIFHSSAQANFDFEEIGKQHKEAQRFIREKFYDPETKTVYGAYHQFEVPTTFEQKLTEHLRRLIINKIGREAIPIEWEGNPYVGLRSFRYDENAIFYGRRLTINSIEEKLTRYLPDKAPCLFVLGESGSGKSSLVRAGLLPDIIEFGWVENTKWKWFDMMPSQFRGNVYNGIVSKLLEAFPSLNAKAIGKDLIAGKEVNWGHLSDVLPGKSDESVLFFIDQMEEIFTDPLITEEERIRTFALLKGIASTHKVWLIFSMRNDFYHKFITYPDLSELKDDSILYDLPKVLHSELQEIVEEPAKKAGLKWEINEQGIPLNRTIIHDINRGVDDLPLIEFALSELYNLRNEDNVLTFKAYEEIGKIDGAVIQYVNRFYNTLSEKEKDLFYQLLSALIAPSLDSKKLYFRKTALLKDWQKSEIHRQLINNLIDSHILTSGKDENDEATVCLVHEILISSWTVIQDWIAQEKYFIENNNHYENLSKYWTTHNQSKNDLLNGSEAIKKSEYFLFSWENHISKQVKDFLLASVKKKRRKFLPWVIFFLLIGCLGVLSWCVQYFSKSEVVKEIFDEFNLTNGSFMKNLLIYIMFGLLIYVAWKKIKAVPIYQTINISLIVWSIAFIFSFVLFYHSGWSSWFLFVLALLKLILTIIKKIEILQWKKRIFKKNFIFDISSLFSLKLSRRRFIVIVAVFLISVLAVCVYFITNKAGVNSDKKEINGSGTVTKEQREVSPFDKLKITGSFTVHLLQGETESVEVEIDDNLQPYIRLQNNGSELVVDTKDSISFGKTIKNDIYVTLKNIELLDVSGKCTVRTSGSLKSNQLTIRGRESLKFKLELNLYCNQLNIILNGVGNIVLRGETTALNINNTGVGNIDAMNLKAANAIVKNTGVGSINVYASQELSMTNTGVGTITYSGDAEIKTMQSDIVGKIKKAKQ